MAAKLQCEICGGKLIGKPGGIFECESCGTEYSTEWAKAKIQEITGTVKVEGTVDVKGTVQVEGAANVESLIKRGNLALEDEKWDEAEKCFSDALNADPEYAEAYLGLVMAGKKLRNKEAYASAYIDGQIDADDKNMRRARQFADGELTAWFNELDKAKAKIDAEKAEEKARKQAEKLAIFKEKEKRLLPVRERIASYLNLISAGSFHTVGLKADGTVVAAGSNYHGECDVQDWSDIVAVSVGVSHTIGLKADGTVVATKFKETGYTKYNGQCDVSGWSDIVAVSAGGSHTVGLKADGTVVAVGDNAEGQCDVDAWKDIVAVSAGTSYTVGLKADGTVVAVGKNQFGRCDVQDWTDIVAVSAETYHTVGLKADGTVVATEYNGDKRLYFGQCDVTSWTDIVAVSAGGWHTVGLKADGTVVAVGRKGRLCDIASWKLFKTEEEKQADYAKACALQESGEEKKLAEAISLFNGLKDYQDSKERAALCKKAYEEKKAARETAERQSKIAALNAEKTALQTELANLKGLFTGRRRKEIEARLSQIENELKRL